MLPLRDFFRNPERSAYSLSPDGQYFAWLANYENRRNIFVQKVGDTGEPLRVTSVTDRDLGGFFWESNNTLVYVRDFGGDENFHLFSVSVNGGEERDLTPFPDVRAEIIDDLEDQDGIMIIGLNKRNPEIFDPYRLNVRTGELEMIAENPGNITSWMTDHDGKLRIAITTDGVNNSILHRNSETEPFRTVITTDFRETVQPLFFTFDNKNVFALSNKNRDKMAVVELDLADAQERQMLFEHTEVDADYLSYSRKRKALTTVTFTTWKKQYHFLDPEVKALYARLANALGPDREIVVTSTNRNEDRFVVRTYSDRSLGSYYMYDQPTDQLTKIADVSPWLDETALVEMKPVRYTARDGQIINGYLTLPKGLDPKNLPVIINPHGGPWARDQWGFNPEIQFLANRGYAVLQMNFRGSTGYGRKFWEISFKQWGLSMQDDISDGVAWLVQEGIADPKRVAIYGGSYGGYATLAGATLTPDLYACAVDYVGVSNLFTFLNTIPPYWKPFLDMMHEMVGDPNNPQDSLRMRATSPVFLAEKIKCPLLIAQGAKDPRVNKDESDQMVAALEQRGVHVKYLMKENEGHGFRNEENRFEFYETMEAFLGEHLRQK